MGCGEGLLVAVPVVKGEERFSDREPHDGLDEMRPVGGPAELTVGRHGHPHLGLQVDQAADQIVLDRPEFLPADLPCGRAPECQHERARPQQAADVIGMEGRVHAGWHLRLVKACGGDP